MSPRGDMGAPVLQRNPRRSRLARILRRLRGVFAGRNHFFQVCYPEDTVASTLTSYQTGAGFEGMYEYEPPGGDDSAIPTGLPDACLVGDPSIVLGKPDPDDPDANPAWTPDQNTCQATFTRVGGLQTNPEHRSFAQQFRTPAILCCVFSAIPRGPSASTASP
jgi:hypothetical protein